MVFRRRTVVFRWRGAGCRICPTQEHAPRRRPPDTAHERKNLPTQERSPRRRLPDTAHQRKDLPRSGTLPTAKASRHSARAKGFAPRRNTPHGEGLPTQRTSERICPAQERSPRRRPLDTAHGRKDLPCAETLSSAKASRHGSPAKGFAPRRNTPLGEGRPTRRTSERICPTGGRVHPACRRTAGRSRPTNSRKNTPSAGSHPRPRTSERVCPAQKRSPRRRPPDTAHGRKDLPHAETLPRRRPPDTAHERKDLPRAGTLPSAKVSRHGARATEFAPRGSRSPHMPTNGGPSPTDEQPEKHTFGGVAPDTARPLPSSFTEKK